MKIINEYAVSIIVVSLLAILLEQLLPDDNNKKYTNVIIGLFVMLVMLNPLTKMPHFDRIFTISQGTSNEIMTASKAQNFVAEDFEKKLAETIIKDIRDTYKTDIDCRIRCKVNESGQITGIQKLSLSPSNPDISKYISEKYDIEEAQIVQ